MEFSEKYILISQFDGGRDMVGDSLAKENCFALSQGVAHFLRKKNSQVEVLIGDGHGRALEFKKGGTFETIHFGDEA